MLSLIFVIAVFAAAIWASLRAGRDDGLIARTPYNNRNSDASGAREDHLS